jgi:hypothetical protein
MAQEAIFRHGSPQFADFTPSTGNVAAGQVVLLGNLTGLTVGIAHQDIANNVQGSVAIGGGVYDCVMLTNIAANTNVWWDDTNNKVSTTSTNFGYFGMTLTGGTGANTTVEVLHKPYSGMAT